MKIAFVSFECIPDTGYGGIGTYTWHAAHMLARAGHHVEVVCGSAKPSRTEEHEGVVFHRVFSKTGSELFGPIAAPVLSERHRTIGFDVLESPDANAEGAEFIKEQPDIPLLVKLHIPLCLIDRYNRAAISVSKRLRFALGAIRRGKTQLSPGDGAVRDRVAFEKQFILNADHVAAPTWQIAQMIGSEWSVPPERMTTFPLPFEDREGFSEIPIAARDVPRKILFVGRLETRKGIHHLGAAMPLICALFPNLRLRCLGRICGGPKEDTTIDKYMKSKAGKHFNAIEFPGSVARDQLACELSDADLCIFPSLWDNFPYVCLEAMMAGRAIIASSSGGMPDMLGGSGVVVEPGSPQRWANAIIKCLLDSRKRTQMAQMARESVLRNFNYMSILPDQLKSYESAIRAHSNRSRPAHFPMSRPNYQ